MNLITLDCLMS